MWTCSRSFKLKYAAAPHNFITFSIKPTENFNEVSLIFNKSCPKEANVCLDFYFKHYISCSYVTKYNQTAGQQLILTAGTVEAKRLKQNLYPWWGLNIFQLWLRGWANQVNFWNFTAKKNVVAFSCRRCTSFLIPTKISQWVVCLQWCLYAQVHGICSEVVCSQVGKLLLKVCHFLIISKESSCKVNVIWYWFK